MLYEVAFQASGTPRRADGNRSEPATGGQRTRNGTVDLYIAGANLDPNDVTLVGVLAAPPGMTPGQLVRFARVDIASVSTMNIRLACRLSLVSASIIGRAGRRACGRRYAAVHDDRSI